MTVCVTNSTITLVTLECQNENFILITKESKISWCKKYLNYVITNKQKIYCQIQKEYLRKFNKFQPADALSDEALLSIRALVQCWISTQESSSKKQLTEILLPNFLA